MSWTILFSDCPAALQTPTAAMFFTSQADINCLVRGAIFKSTAHLVRFCELMLKHLLSVRRDRADIAAVVLANFLCFCIGSTAE